MEELKARILEIVEDYEEGISVLDNDMAQAGIDPKSDFVNTIEQLLEERECRAREEGVKMGMENAWGIVSALLDTLDVNNNEEEIRALTGVNKLFDREITKLALKLKNNK